MKSKIQILVSLMVVLLGAGCGDEIGIKWHSYIHSPSGQIHYVLDLARYKRGLFFGSCGPATRSLQWEYNIELSGAGPRYPKEAIELQDSNYHPLSLDSGFIVLDPAKRTATINLAVIQDSKVKLFPHNGTYRLQKKP